VLEKVEPSFIENSGREKGGGQEPGRGPLPGLGPESPCFRSKKGKKRRALELIVGRRGPSELGGKERRGISHRSEQLQG